MPRTRAEIIELLDGLDDCVAEDLEDQDLDFKQWDERSDRQSVRMVVSAAVCMANGGGGTVVLGVADRRQGRDSAIQGVPPVVSVNRLRLAVHDGTDPKLTPVFEEVMVPEGTGRVILMHIHPGLPPYTDTSGRGTVRVGRDCKPLTGTMRHKLAEETGDSDYTAVAIDVPLAQLVSPAAMETLRAAAKRDRASDSLLDRADGDLLEAIGASRDGIPTRAAALLAAAPDAVRRHVPLYDWTYLRMSSGTDYSARADGNDSIAVAVSRVLDRIMADNPIETVREGAYHFEHATYPEVALREALLNAFCHSDYRLASPRLVKHYRNRIEITSPGGFLGGITAENILHHRPVTRNPCLVDAMVRLRLVNRANLGTARMYYALLIEGKPPPVIEDIGGTVRVTFHASKLSVPFRRFTAAEERGGRVFSVDHLLILNFLYRDSEIGLATAARICHRSEGEVRETLTTMVSDLGYLERVGSDNTWTLSTDVRQRILAPGSDDGAEDWATLKRRVLRVIRRCHEMGEPPLANVDVRRITGLDRHQVRRLIGELRSHGLVAIDGRGRGTRYLYTGPGVRPG